MHLSNIKIWNFRKYGTKDKSDNFTNDNYGLNLYFNKGINVLVGENDSGKTAIIDAIKHTILTQSKEYIAVEEKDFHRKLDGTETKKLKIECTFSGFDNEGKEAAHFLEWINFAKNEKEENEYELKVKLTAEIKDNRIITDIRAGADAEGSALDGNARDLLRATYLKPLRDAEAELTPGYKSRLAQILKSHKAFDKSDDENKFINSVPKKDSDPEGEKIKQHDLEKIIKIANEEITGFFDKEEVKNEIKGKLTETLTKFFPDNEVLKKEEEQDKTNIKKEPIFKIADSDLSSILKKLSLTLEDNKSGLGALNLLFIAAELLLLETERADSLQLLLIEEIEAHLHAQAQLRLIDYFENEKKKGKQQLILTTHSITLASKISLENLIICKGDKAFPMGHKHTKLEQGDYKFLERFLDATKANLFFARGVIIVEGDAENLLIPTIAEIIGRPLHKHGVSIVNVGSTAFKRYAKIFLRIDEKGKLYDKKDKWLDIPVAIISDVDVKPKEYYIEKEPDTEMPDIKTQIYEETNKLETQWNIQNIKISITKCRTLEYDIALGNFQKEIFHAILIAQKIKNSKDEKFYKDIFNDKNEFEIPNKIKEKQEKLFSEWGADADKEEKNSMLAYKIYQYIKDKQVSKAITAQIFSEILNTDKANSKKKILEDDFLKYIVDAINYATGKPE